MSSRRGRNIRHCLLVLAAFVTGITVCPPAAVAGQMIANGSVPPAKMYGYAPGPAQHDGTAAGRSHYVPASATRTDLRVPGHSAPVPELAPPAMAARQLVPTGETGTAPGHVVTHAGTSGAVSQATVQASPTVAAAAATVADNASFSVAATYDTVPMANQTGRVAVTLTNAGTATWSGGFGLVAKVYPASNTTGTGTPLTTGQDVTFQTTVAPGQSVPVEGVTPNENPGTYTICWDMETPAGVFFSANGGSTYCSAYSVQQYPAQVNEQSPLPGSSEDTQTPQLSASATIPGGFPAKPEFWFAFQVLTPGATSGTWTVVQSSGWIANNGSTWTVPKPLSWGSTYYWDVTVSDASTPPSLSSPPPTWTTPISFVVSDAQPAVWNRFGPVVQTGDGNPVMTFDLGSASYTGSGKTVDPKTANVTQQVTDASVAAAGPTLSVMRTYNSLDPRTSQAYGAGWSSAQDMSLAPDSDGTGALILTLASGQQVRFAKNASGGYAPPQDMYAVVTALSGGGFSVTDQTDTTYSFAQASGTSWLLSKITDDQGGTETFSYTSGQLTTVTNNVSARALHLTWSTPAGAAYPHVATVATDAVTAGQPSTALTWTYSYSGDLLTAVCPPGTTTACTKYTYITNGSHGPTAVRNANPTAYYRLDDPSGATAAANEIPVNDLTTVNPPATEMNTTPGVAGLVAGVTATGFNGTSSFLPVDGTWCTTASQTSSCIPAAGSNRIVTSSTTSLGVSVWFKTSTPSGVLLGLTTILPGGCATGCSTTNAFTMLSITSTGQLAGAGALTSTAVVDDGQWHQAVLIPGKALYLDGAKVASGSTAFTTPAGDYALLGTGLSTSGSWQYFNGSLLDFAVYQNELPSAGTVAAQYTAETKPAAELSGITSPGGRTEMSATYDTLNDRVASLTDAHGGAWKYSLPVTQSLSAGYDNAVLGSAPEDFWPLSDASGPLAHDLVGGAATAAVPRPPATYANVTLGVTGPTGFADGTAAGFSGSGSQVSIPGGYFAGTGGAGESAELWFSATKAATLLSTGSGTGGNPPTLWLDSSGCVEGNINGILLKATAACTSAIGDGKWHQVAFTLTPVGTNSTGSATIQTATLYEDGKVLASNSLTPATLSAAGYTAVIGNGSHGDFTGSIADVSLYTTTLSAADVTAHYAGLQNQVLVKNGGTVSQPTYLATPSLDAQTITVTDPFTKNASYVYSSGKLIKTTDVLGGVTWYGYDASSRATTVTDPDGYTTYTTHDTYNNVTSTTTCAAINDCQTSYESYYENPGNPLDPRNNKPTDEKDARSSLPSDPAYDTVIAYTTLAQLASKTTPPTAACPSGCKTSFSYTIGSEPAAGGGTEPAGLLASTTSPNGGVTTYAYDSAGDVTKVTNPAGLVTTHTYDNLGRVLTSTQVSDTFPAGLTTTHVYDSLDRLVKQTDPPVTDRVTGAVHTEVTTTTYDPDGDVLTTTSSDTTGGDASRTTTNTYDAYGDLASVTDALGHLTKYTYDALGDRITKTNPAGVTTAYGYDATGKLLTTTLDGYTGNPSAPIPAENLVQDSRSYDPAGRLASDTTVKGTTTDYTYYGDGKLASRYVPGTPANVDVHTYTYDAAGNKVSETDPGGLVIDTVYNADNHVTSQTTDPTGVDRTSAVAYDADGNVITRTLTGGGVTQTQTMTYDAMDRELTQTTDNTGGNLTTTSVRDERGLVISMTDPAGNTTTYQNDEGGRKVVTIAPAVASQTGNGAAPVTANPVTMTGYDTFGDKTEISDADGNVTKYAYDLDGQQVSITSPSYTPPGSTVPVNGTSTMTYDNLGHVISQTDPLGSTVKWGYDQLGDQSSVTDPGGGVTTYTYDPAGEQLSVTDPTGAQTQATYNSLGQLVTTTDLVRQNSSAAYVTTYTYDAAGNRISQTSPTGVVTRAVYDAVGEETSVTDGAGNTTTSAYNLDGGLIKATLPDGSATTATYDLAGRQTGQSDLSASGTVLRSESATYTQDGLVATSTDSRGDTYTFSYDATGMRTSQTQPVSASASITVGYGYDLNGNRTALTDGNGHPTYTTYNSLGKPETIAEPATAAHSTAADSTTTDIYDADGNLITTGLPGGVQVTRTYDAMGDLTGQSGSGATAPTASRSYTYDTAGRLLTAATGAVGTQGTSGYQPATAETFQYDDRDLLLSASGAAGVSVYTYNGSAQLTSTADPAGTSSYAYDSAARLQTDADAGSGTTGTYTYNSLDQVTRVSYGSGNDTQSFGYDTLHRLASDTVATASGATAASIGYGYNLSDDVTSVTTTGLATAGGTTGTVTNAYGYDEAHRLTSWTATPSGGTATTQAYGYDNAGNMTNDNGVSYTYDARDELVSGSNGTTYAYTADGELQSAGSAAYMFDAYGQQITAGTSGNTWDALNRVVTAGEQNGSGTGEVLTYEGMTKEVASDSSATYSRDPGGLITGVNAVAGGKTIALNDQHSDLSGLFTAAGATMTGSATYSPWGQVTGSTGRAVQVGYQGQWTDPQSGQVSMGSRFYRPGTGGFTSKDTYTGAEGGTSAVSDNLFAYGNDNPVTVTDPSGHSPSGGSSAGTITGSEVSAAEARAAEARSRAASLDAEAAKAKAKAATLADAAASAERTAATLNSEALKAQALTAEYAKAANLDFVAAAAEMTVAQSWQDKANAAFSQARADLRLAVLLSWNLAGAYYAGQAYKEYSQGNYDQSVANAATQWANQIETWAEEFAQKESQEAQIAAILTEWARGAAQEAAAAKNRAQSAAHDAQALASAAAQADATARADEAYAANLRDAYAAQQARKAPPSATSFLHTLAHTAQTIGHAATTVGKTIYKASGAQSVVACATKHDTADCVQAAVAVVGDVSIVLTAGADTEVVAVGEGVVDAAAAGTADVAAAGTADAAAGAADVAAGDASTVDELAASCGGMSFSADTRVVLPSGAAASISQLKPGDKVVAEDTKTGKDQPETVTAVLVHHDTDLYDLTVKTSTGTEVIHTTASHLFWDPYLHYGWIPAKHLKPGMHLKTPDGRSAVVVGGSTPAVHDGWMWDLTVPGNNDHDFYVLPQRVASDRTYYSLTKTTPVLVHNEDYCQLPLFVLKDGETSTAEQIANSTPGGGTRVGQAAARQRLLDQANGDYQCWRCGMRSTNPDDMHLGHVNKPTSLGGNLADDNICLEGAACNLSAGNRGYVSPGMSCAERGSCGAPYGR